MRETPSRRRHNRARLQARDCEVNDMEVAYLSFGFWRSFVKFFVRVLSFGDETPFLSF
jgi:hypothetical protein